MTVFGGHCIPLACAADCSSTYGVRLLALDTSHLFVLMRIARRLQPSTIKVALLQLIDAHTCHSRRHLVASDYVVAHEVLAIPSTPDDAHVSSFLSAADISQRMVMHDDSAWPDLPSHCPSPSGRQFGQGDRRWVACLEAAAGSHDDAAYMATDDEDLILNVRDCVEAGQIDSMPIHTTDLLWRLKVCGAVGLEVIEAMLEAEEARIHADAAMQERKRSIKLERLDRVAAKVGLADA
jgi:hypothetical protein